MRPESLQLRSAAKKVWNATVGFNAQHVYQVLSALNLTVMVLGDSVMGGVSYAMAYAVHRGISDPQVRSECVVDKVRRRVNCDPKLWEKGRCLGAVDRKKGTSRVGGGLWHISYSDYGDVRFEKDPPFEKQFSECMAMSEAEAPDDDQCRFMRAVHNADVLIVNFGECTAHGAAGPCNSKF